MFTARKTLQIQWAMLAAGLALATYFVFVYLPLHDRARALDEPLRKARQHLIDLNVEHPFVGGLEPERIADTMTRMEQDLDALKRSEQALLSRLELDAPTRAKLHAPFQLIDYQNERQFRIEELIALAKKQSVTVDPTALVSFPEFVTDRPDPALLWAQLYVVNHLLSLAVQCRVTTVHSLQAPHPEPLRLADNGAAFADAIPIRLELSGPADALTRFLRAIPLRSEEAKALGLPEPLPAKPALFIERLLLRKTSSDKLDQGHLEILVRGYIYRD